MPHQVKIIRERNSAQWDTLIRDVIQRQHHGVEHDYFGCVSEARADRVRRALRTAGKHLGVSVKAYWKPCPAPGKCTAGGDGCSHHVYYTVYDMELARQYVAGRGGKTAQ